MRIQSTDKREREWKELKEATGERTKSGAIDVAVRYYLRMHGDNPVAGTGVVENLMREATEQGSLTAAEIAGLLDVDELPVEHTETWSRGRD